MEMALDYKCPNCGGSLHFDVGSDNMICDYCGTRVAVSQAAQQEDFAEEAGNASFFDGEEMSVTAYECSNCGAQIMTDEQTAATFCSYCGNPALIETRLCSVRKPSRLVPFKKDKQEAVAAFKKWSKHGLLTPFSFTKSTTVEKITGIYVPFWLLDCRTDVDYRANATIVHTEFHGDMEKITTKYYQVYRNVSVNYGRIPADASEKMDDYMMDCLEPFAYDELVPFQMPYLSGFYAEKYTYTDAELHERVKKRTDKYAEAAARETIQGMGYTTVTKTSVNTQVCWQNAEYVMFPVWLLNYKYRGKIYTFAMNGQTGKVVGKLPTSRIKMLATFLILFTVIYLLLIGGGS